MSAINAVLRPLFDAVLAPIAGLPAIVGVAVFSLILSVVALWLVKLTSNEAKVDAAKRKVAAGLLEIRLFNDDLPTIFRAVGSILKHQGAYVLHLLVPFILMILVFLPFIAQLQFHWGYEGLEPGDVRMLKVTLQEGWDGAMPSDGIGEVPRPAMLLELPAGVQLDSPPVWSPSTREIAWRLVAESEGDHELGIRVGDQSHAKSFAVTDRIQRLSPSRWVEGFLNQLIYPAEPALDKASGIESIAFEYSDRDIWFLFWRLHWLIVFLILTIVFALILRGPMGVTI